MNSSQSPSTDHPIVIERVYVASVEELWQLWTTKDGFESWWGPEGFRVEVKTLEASTGGKLEYSMIADHAGTIAYMEKKGMPISHDVSSTFTELTELRSLELTSLIDFLPGVERYEVRANVSFQPLGDRARMVVTLQRYHSEEWTMRAKAGWESQLTKLPKALERRRASA
jgi:uncharacterized protein YndB with AHSA1/START domain